MDIANGCSAAKRISMQSIAQSFIFIKEYFYQGSGKYQFILCTVVKTTVPLILFALVVVL